MTKFNNTKKYYESGYKKYGLNFQRRYPNEELCRFFGRNFFSIKISKRKKIKILETGCGTAGNLQMISKEGFSAYGIDISSEAIKLSKEILDKEKLKCNLTPGDFTSMPYKNKSFSCVVDVFSSCCLDKNNGLKYIKEINRVLKKKGKFFSYFPSKKSDMFKTHYAKTMHDADTMKSLKKKISL